MLPEAVEAEVRAAVMTRLEAIIDPCSAASGAPAGLVSMGLVGPVTVEGKPGAAKVGVVLYITEPGCMMGALFELTARRQLALLPGVAAVEITMDYAHVWGPEQMAPDYRRRLAEIRACRTARMAAEFGAAKREGRLS